jgi:hypothetical protein
MQIAQAPTPARATAIKAAQDTHPASGKKPRFSHPFAPGIYEAARDDRAVIAFTNTGL